MKFHPIFPLLVASALTFSCGSDFSLEKTTTYKGKLVFGDGNKYVTLELLVDGKAHLGGLYPNVARGTWEKAPTGLGYEKDGVKATFDGMKSNEGYRIVFMLQPRDDGLVLADIRGRLLKDKPSTLRSLKLKEKKPLLKRTD
jgi:hypothetical protein